MVLIIGGAYQGKTAYAQTKYALRDAEIFTCEGEALDLTARCLRHLERFALACVRAGKEPADVLAGLALSGRWPRRRTRSHAFSAGFRWS